MPRIGPEPTQMHDAREGRVRQCIDPSARPDPVRCVPVHSSGGLRAPCPVPVHRCVWGAWRPGGEADVDRTEFAANHGIPPQYAP